MSTLSPASTSFSHQLAFTLLFTLASIVITAQSYDYSVSLEPIEIEGLGGVQSFAVGHLDNTWLVVGGRLDGLHRRQPFASFDPNGNNTSLWVIQPESGSFWKQSLNDLPESIQEQLSSTNMEFIQKDGWLYCIGGYGYSPSLGDHTTYGYLTAIEIQPTINAIKSGRNPSKFIQQIVDDKFRVTGGQLEVIDSTFYLLGGQNFQGRYNPHGPNHGPGFFQEYTEAIRTFRIFNSSGRVRVEHIDEVLDTDAFHRRDYNASPFLTSTGQKGIIMFSGVFQKESDLPFLDAVEVTADGYKTISDFEHLLNHYHCPVLPFHNPDEDKMHHLFFGGISQFYFQDNKLIRDDNVPFVNTIGLTTRLSDGSMNERALKSTMPGYLGAGSEFIPNDNLSFTNEGVLIWSSEMGDTLDAGHIFGGIRSSAANIFFINDGTQSEATSTLFRVRLVRSKVSKISRFSNQNNLKLSISPNPGSDEVLVSFELERSDNVELQIVSLDGAVLKRTNMGDLSSGRHKSFLSLENIPRGDHIILAKGKNYQQGQLVTVRR